MKYSVLILGFLVVAGCASKPVRDVAPAEKIENQPKAVPKPRTADGKLVPVPVQEVKPVQAVEATKPVEKVKAVESVKPVEPVKDVKAESTVVTDSAASAPDEIACKFKGETRTLKMERIAGGGCKLWYSQKPKEPVAESPAATRHCEKVKNNIKSKLEAAGYTCAAAP